MKYFLSAFLMACSSVSFATVTWMGASELKIKVYKFAVSTSVYCTNLQTIIDNGDDPQELDFIGSVNLGSGSISPGTYPCVVIEMSDNIKFKPDTNLGNCSTSTQNTQDVCRAGGNPAWGSVLIDGTSITCTGTDGSPVPNRVALYLSTYSDNSGDSFLPPTASTQNGITLTEPLIVTGSSTGNFIVDTSGKVCSESENGCNGSGGGSACSLDAPTFSFSQ